MGRAPCASQSPARLYVLQGGSTAGPSHYRTQCPLPSVSLTAPVYRGLLQLESPHQEIGTIVEIIERGAGPIRGLARRRVAIAPCRDPFAGAEHIAGTNGFLRIRGVNRARLVEAPGPGRTGRAFQRAFALRELLERELGIHGAYALGVGAGLDGIARDRGQVRAVLDIARADRHLRIAWLWDARGGRAECKLLLAEIILSLGRHHVAQSGSRHDEQNTQADGVRRCALSHALRGILAPRSVMNSRRITA